MSFLFYLGFFLLLVHNYYSHAVGNNDPRTTNNNSNHNSNKNSKNAPHLVIPKNAVLAFSIMSSARRTLSSSRNSRTTDCKTTTAARTVDPITTTARQRRFHGIFCSNRHNMVSDPSGGVTDPTGLPNATTSTSTSSSSSSSSNSSSSSSSSTNSNNSYNTMKTTTQSSFTPNKPPKRVTLRRYLHNIVKADPSLRDLESLSLSIQMACKTISNLVSRAGINSSSVSSSSSSSSYNNSNNNNYSSSSSALEEERDAGLIQYDYRMNSMKRLDQLSTIVLRNALRFTGKLQSVQKAKDDDDKQDDDDDDDDDDDVQDDQEKVDGPQSRRKKELSNRGLRRRGGGGGGGVPSEHQPGVLIASTLDSKYIAIFDPLDGSGNADAAICTGTVFGIFQTGETDQDDKDNNNDDDDDDDDQEGIDNVVVGGGDGMDHPSSPNILVNSVLQPGKKLVAAGYCLYSSSTILVFTLGEGTHGFTLDPQINEFVLTHPNIKIPPRGNVYSCNEANSEGWSDDVRKYLHALKSGENETGERYALRYVGSMVGDIHRTLMYGGIFFYPADSKLHPKGHLQLLYKSAPLSFVIQQAGGRSTNGRVDLLGVTPSRVHETSPCFIGSPEDIEEMKTYVLHDD